MIMPTDYATRFATTRNDAVADALVSCYCEALAEAIHN